MKKYILYPRGTARISYLQSAREPQLIEEIAAIRNSEVIKKLAALEFELRATQRAKPQFTCWSCANQISAQDLTLYDFISYSRDADEDRYDDFNIICPGCGKFSTVDRKANHAMFKCVEKVEEAG